MGNGLLTRDRILQAALKLFAQHGYEGARMEQIAAEVGINKASLYFHFKSKEEIFHELFRMILNNYQTKITQILLASKGLTSKERLIYIYQNYLDYNWNNAEMDFWNRIYYFPPETMKKDILQGTINIENNFIAELTGVIEEGIKRKEIKSLPSSSIAKAYYYILTCIGLSNDLMQKEQALDDMDQCLLVFWEGIKGM